MTYDEEIRFIEVKGVLYRALAVLRRVKDPEQTKAIEDVLSLAADYKLVEPNFQGRVAS
jgi:hypothetical protein